MTFALFVGPLLLAIVALYSTLAIRSTLTDASRPTNPRKTSRTTLFSSAALCEHTVSNGNLVADSSGAVCRWAGVDPATSCCAVSEVIGGACADHCDLALQCCAVYEHCVACCVSGEPFAACVARCRTHSGSAAAREFVDVKRKHCFGVFNAPAPAFDRLFVASQRESSAATSRVFSGLLALLIALPFLLR